MTKIKLCGIKRPEDIQFVNALMPDYIGFVFAKSSRRYVSFSEAKALRAKLHKGITPVGVFLDEEIQSIEALVKEDIIQAVQLHGREDNFYIKSLRQRVSCPIIQAFRIEGEEDIQKAGESEADYVMLDSGGGTGKTFDHSLAHNLQRDFFLAGGLTPENVAEAVATLRPFGVDASSSLETDGVKDKNKMAAFVGAVRKDEREKR